MAVSSRSAVLGTYKALLRAVDTHVTAKAGNALWRDAVRDGFRASRTANGEAAERALLRAEHLTFYVNSVNEHKARALRDAALVVRVPGMHGERLNRWPCCSLPSSTDAHVRHPQLPESLAVVRHQRGQGGRGARPREANGCSRGALRSRRRLLI